MKLSKQLGKKALSMFLAILMIVTALPLSIFAADIDSTPQTSDDDYSLNLVKNAFEVEDLRSETVKHFRLEDGSYIAAQYDKPVHYQDDDGNWQDIDNTLNESGSEFSTSNARVKFAKKITGNEVLFTLHENNQKITMTLDGAIKKTTGTIFNNNNEDNSSELQKMMNLEKISAKVLYEDILNGVDLEYVVDSYDIKENIIVKEKTDNYTYTFTMQLNNLVATLDEKGQILLSDAAAGIVEYIIPAPTACDANGTFADNALVHYTLTDAGNGKYSLSVNVDSAWMNSDDREYPIVLDPPISVPKSSVTDLDINSNAPSSNYSSSSTMYVGATWRGYWKVSTLPYIPESAYITNASLSLRSSSTSGNYVGAYQVTTNWDSTLTWNKTIATSAQGTLSTTLLDYNCINGTSAIENRYVWDITDLVRDWYSDSANNYGVGFQIVSGTTPSGNSIFDTTNTTSTANYPKFTISYKDMKGIEDYWTYAAQSAGFAGTGYINYATGKLTFGKSLLSTTDSLMPYSPAFVYSSALANDMFQYPNAEVPQWNTYMPFGFKFSINETIIKRSYTSVDGESLYMYILSDEDGTEHYFLPLEENGVKSSTKYQDDDGLQLILDTSSTTLTITDNSKNVRYYTQLQYTSSSSGVLGSWYLSSISDAIGNKIIFDFESAPFPNKVSLQPNGSSLIDFLIIEYNFDSLPYIIWNKTSKEAIIFRYSSTHDGSVDTFDTCYLRKIEYAHSTVELDLTDWEAFYNNSSNNDNIVVDASAEYTYDSNGYLTKATDTLSGYEIRYTYNSGGQVIYVQEYAGSTAGQKMYYSYYNGYTTVRSSGSDDVYGNTDDIITRYTFDREGRVKSMYSTDYTGTQIYGASSGEYESQDNIKNNLKTTVVLGGSTSNYLLNGGFEKSSDYSADHWFTSSNNVGFAYGLLPECGIKTANFHISDYDTDYIGQYTFLKSGTYTLSATINTYNCKNVKLFMKAESLSNVNNVYIEEVPINEYYASGQPSFANMTFEVGNYTSTGGENFKISFYFESEDVDDENDDVCISIDNVMLEENLGASSYSLIQYGNFERFSIDSSGTYLGNGAYFWTSQDGTLSRSSAAAPFGYVGYITGEISRNKFFRQTVYTAPDDYLYQYDEDGGYTPNSESKTYIISGFGKGTGQVNNGNSHFGFRIEVYYYQGSGNEDYIETYNFDFETDCTDWQFLTGSFKTIEGALVRKINVYCDYAYQPGGAAYFDEVSLIENHDDSVVEYTYYENGLLWVKKSGYYTEIYEYNDDKQITRVANNRGQITDYVYDSNGVTVDHEIAYTFKHGSSKIYPYTNEDPDSVITKTPATKTQYEYNAYGQMTSSSTFEVEYSGTSIVTKSGTEYVTTGNTYETTAGSHIFGALIREDDNRYIFTRYYYDQTNGRLLAVINTDDGTGTCYTYDAIGNVTSVLPAKYVSNTSYSSVTNSNSVDYTYNSANLLQSIKTESTEYEFFYDGFGNTDSVTIGENEIVNYEYNLYNGKLHTINYNNGFSVNYVYDELENIKEVWYNDNGVETKAFEYHYTAYGQMSRFDNLLTGKSISYKYDNDNRMTSYVEHDTDNMVNTFSSTIFYDEQSNPSSVFYSMDYYAGTTVVDSDIHYYHAFNYSDGTLNYYTVDTNTTGGEIDYSYDGFKRLEEKIYDFYVSGNSSTRYTNTVNYTFVNSPWNTTKTSSLVKTVTSKVNDYAAVTYTYEYDYNGNVTKISLSNGTEFRYVYDDLGQLLREDNTVQNRTYVYTYDNAGNILTKSTYALTAAGSTPSTLYSTYNYLYGDTTWGDKLTSYRGVSFTYDEIGNPLTYYNGSSYSFSWENARQLATLSKGSYNLSFEYNNEGIRTSKTVNGVEHIYHLSNSLVMAEEWGNHLVLYLYDTDGSPIGMQYRNTSYAEGTFDTYWFEKNLQGDVVAVYNQAGTKLISYTYDAWGNSSASYYNSGASTTATYNPFRYRGYYLDSESGFYYLNSRYYDPAIGRFITADKLATVKATAFSVTDKNLYAYCDNNPVTRTDNGGAFWDTAFDVVSLCFSVAEVVANPYDPWAWAGFVGDAVDLIPFVSGVGEVTRAVNTVRKVLDVADDLHDAGKAIDNATDAIDGTIDTYKALKKVNKGNGLEVHHIVEKRFAPALGINKNKTGDMLSIALDKQTHRKFTNAWREIKYGTNYNNLMPEQIWEVAQKVYAGYPDLLEAARKTIFN